MFTWGFPEIGVPPVIIRSTSIVHYKSSIWGVPPFMETLTCLWTKWCNMLKYQERQMFSRNICKTNAQILCRRRCWSRQFVKVWEAPIPTEEIFQIQEPGVKSGVSFWKWRLKPHHISSGCSIRLLLFGCCLMFFGNTHPFPMTFFFTRPIRKKQDQWIIIRIVILQGLDNHQDNL